MGTSLPRVLEAEAMDTAEEATEYDTMDHQAVNVQFVDDLLAAGEVVGDVLDLGTGTAQIPVALCRRVEECRVMAIDLSVSMLDLARYNIEVAGLIERIFLNHIDCKELPYESDSFAVVISNSIVHHVPEPASVLSEAVRVAEPAGLIFVRDLLRPSSAVELEQLVQQYTAGNNDFQRKMFHDSLCAALTLDEIRALVEELGLDPVDVQLTSDRHWTWTARLPT